MTTNQNTSEDRLLEIWDELCTEIEENLDWRLFTSFHDATDTLSASLDNDDEQLLDVAHDLAEQIRFELAELAQQIMTRYSIVLRIAGKESKGM